MNRANDDGAFEFDLGARPAALAEVLQAKIMSGTLSVGDSLPAERDLMSLYSISRATVREALRILGAKGLIEVKRGRKGGSYISAPTGAAISQSLDLFIQGHDIRFVDLLAVREAIEPVAAGQAARERLPEDIADIDRLLTRQEELIEDLHAFSKLNVDWHIAVVRASHNPLFITMMTSISSALYSATSRDEFNLETRRIVMKAHRKISEAIMTGDPDAASRRMKRHVTSYAEELDLDLVAPHLGTAE